MTFKTNRTLLFAFMNGSYKKINVTNYDHKEWIIAEKPDGRKVFINSANVKWIEEQPNELVNKTPETPNNNLGLGIPFGNKTY